MALKRRQVCPSELEPIRKKNGALLTSFYARVKAWILYNYETRSGSFTLCDDVLTYAKEQKENLMHVSPNTISKAISEVFGGSSSKCRIRITEGREKKRVWVFTNLKRKDLDECPAMKSCHEQWETLKSTGTDITCGDLKYWSFTTNTECSISFVRCETVSYDDQRVVSELIFVRRDTDIKVSMKYHQRVVPEEHLQKIEAQFGECSIVEKARNLMTFLDNSYVCHGFVADQPYHFPGSKTHTVTVDETAEERLFSLDCEVLTNSTGTLCKRCKDEKKNLKRRSDRHTGIDLKPTFNHRYMSREELIKKIEKEKKKRLAEIRLREKIQKDMIELEGNDSTDMLTMMNEVSKEDIPEDMDIFWQEQQKILKTKSKTQYRWHPRIIKLCVEIYAKNPHVLDPLRKFLYLPSNRTIRHYKNKVDQKPGWNPEMLKWCLDEARKNKLREEDFWGGFVLDEMKIQEDIEMVVKGGKHRLVGFVDLGRMHDNMETLSGNTETVKMATHVLQFIFLGDSGFRFPIAQFPSSSCTPSSLYFIFWEGTRKMLETGFTVYYCILDGAEVNRQFIKVHFSDGTDVINKKFVTANIYNGKPMVFLMDPKHNFKKLRNNILKSSQSENATRHLTYTNKSILWEHFVNAFNFDQGEFSMPLHEKLTAEHFELNPASKMRNHLAEDVLNTSMLNLMKAYKSHLKSKPGQDHTMVDATIELLGHSAKMINLFHDKYVITTLFDSRLKDLDHFIEFLKKWKSECPAADDKKFLSHKLFFDMQSMVLGFESIVATKLQQFPNSVIKPAIVNQDVVENHFCQVRACNGQNQNPTWRLQECAQNSIRYGQTTISRKSNAGSSGLKKCQN